MAHHATITPAGALTGFFDDSVHATIPPGAVQLSDEQYAQWLAGQGAWTWSAGSLVAAPAPPAPPPPPQPTRADLMAQITALLAKVEALPTDPAAPAAS